MTRSRIDRAVNRYIENLRYPEMIAGGVAFFASAEPIYHGQVSGFDKPEALEALAAGSLSGLVVSAVTQAYRIRRQNRLISTQNVDGAGGD